MKGLCALSHKANRAKPDRKFLVTTGRVVDRARERRFRLHEAMCDLEAAASTPAKVSSWTADLSLHLKVIEDALLGHIAEVESPDGLIARIIEDAPRLCVHTEQLLADHPRLLLQTRQVMDQVDAVGPAPDADAVGTIRDAALGLLGELSRHRQLGADLVYEAYAFDIGGGD